MAKKTSESWWLTISCILLKNGTAVALRMSGKDFKVS